MRLVMFGGSFNPPHKGHVNAAMHAAKQLRPDRLLVIPDYLPPHKLLAEGSPTPEQRLELCRLAFAGVPGAEVSDLEIARGGKSYTSDTLRVLRARYPTAELVLLVGSDMLRTLDAWHESAYIFQTAAIRAFPRNKGETAALKQKAAVLRDRFGADAALLQMKPLSAASTDIRAALHSRGGLRLLGDPVYGYIVKNRLYGVKVNLRWLRKKGYAMLSPKRVAHVYGCEEEAVRLARRWGADEEVAAEAAILHDCTKKESQEEQLRLCEKYGIIPDETELANAKLLHARTGAAVAAREFGLEGPVSDAIRWHTTGRAGMTLQEQVMYMADYIEPNRNFEGVEKLRKLAYEDLDAAMLLGLEMSLEDIRSRDGERPHHHSVEAAQWFRARCEEKQD